MRLPRIDFTAIPTPIVLRGSPQQAHRDPCGHYHDGVFRVWHSSIRFHGSSPAGCALREVHGHASLGLAWSDDLVHWDWPQGGISNTVD